MMSLDLTITCSRLFIHITMGTYLRFRQIFRGGIDPASTNQEFTRIRPGGRVSLFFCETIFFQRDVKILILSAFIYIKYRYLSIVRESV